MTERNGNSSQSVFAYAGEGLRRLVSSGVYYAWFKHAGKQYHQSLGTTDKKHAVRLLRELRNSVENVTSTDAARVNFETIAARWIDSRRGNVKQSTLTRDQTCIDNLEPYFRTKTLSGITAADCESWRNRRIAECAPATFRHELRTLKTIFEYAIEHGIIYNNRARRIKRPRLVATRGKNVPTREQFPLLIAAIRSNNGKPDAKNGADFVELVAYSGMRKAEAAALKWQDVDFAKNQLTVTGGTNRTKNYETRSVPISAELHGLLSRLRAGAQPAPTDYVTRIDNPRKCILTACRKLGFPEFTPHNFRDYFATTCMEAGTDVRTIAGWLGHKDGGALLLKTYAHLRQEHSQEAMKKITFGLPKAAMDRACVN
jgi:integrase